MQRLHQNSVVADVLLAQIVLGLFCCLGFWWADAAYLSGAAAGVMCIFLPNSLLVWQQKRAAHASRFVMQSATKWAVTMMLMALSFGVMGVAAMIFFVSFMVLPLCLII